MRGATASRKSCIAFALLLAYFISTFSFLAELEAQEATLGKPKLVVAESVYDFGSINSGSKVKHDFALRNEGESDLVIQRVVAACGCTATSTSNNGIIPAKSEGSISVEFDSTGFSGDKYKPVTVYTNDSDKPTLTLALKGSIEPDIEVTPHNVFFGDIVKSRGVLSQQVSLAVPPNSKLSIGEVKTFSKYLKVNQISGTDRAKKIEISVLPEAPLGELRDRVIVTLNGAEPRTINIPVYGMVKGDLRLTPNTLSFGIIEGTQQLVRSVKLESFARDALEVKEIKSDNPAVSSSFKTIKPGSIYVLEVSVDPAKVRGDLRASLDVVTNKPEDKLALNVYGVTPAK